LIICVQKLIIFLKALFWADTPFLLQKHQKLPSIIEEDLESADGDCKCNCKK